MVGLMRRLQMHGLALTALTSRPSKYIISEQAKDKHINRIDMSYGVPS